MSILFTLLSFVCIIMLLVFVHELGHFLFARLFGVYVEVFSIGFGKKLVGYKDKKGTIWQIAPIPLGGYVRMFGEFYISQADRLKKIQPKLIAKAFVFKPLYQRALIVMGGPLANFIFAGLCFASIYIFQGIPVSTPDIKAIVENSPAEKAGIIVGDVFKTIDGKNITNFQDVKEIVFYSPNKSLEIEVLRKQTTLKIIVVPQEKNVKDVFDNQHKIGYLGVQGGSIIYKDIGVIASLGEGFVDVWQFTNQMMVGIYRLVTGHHSSDEIGSVLRIADMSGKVTQIGYAATLWFIGVLSINLGLINLLPIPVLDGGHLVFYLIEAITGRPVGMKVYNLANKIGLFVILALSVLAISNDILFFLSK